MNIGSQHVIRIFPGQLSPAVQSTAVSVGEFVTSEEVIQIVLAKLDIDEVSENFELVEVCYRDSVYEEESEKILQASDFPVQVVKSWNCLGPNARKSYRIFIREKAVDETDSGHRPKSTLIRHHWMDCHENIRTMANDLTLDLDSKLPDDDLCGLPNLDEEMLLKHLQERFALGRIYTYVGEILLAVNPFRFFPIYNPKFINVYNNKNLSSLPPHIFAIADVAFYRMLKEKKSQCIVISGESGSGKTESTKLIVHHLTALSRKTQASDVEKTILGVGPVLEAFGNAKTTYNNNSSRFGKLTQIKFREDGAVTGAALRKYLLEKSRIVSQAPQERNYHVFYYLLAGASAELKAELHLNDPREFSYLNQSKCYTIEGIDESYEFLRLKQSMEMVGFTADVQKRIFCALSAVLHIGNIQFKKKPSREDEVVVKDGQDLKIISDLLMVTEEKLTEVLTARKRITRGEQFIVPYDNDEALATRDAMAKALYGTLFDWIVLQVNHVLVVKQQSAKEWCSIGVLDIFGFEDFECNSFEQLCINFANEKLQYYFNQHIFRLEQDEYITEDIEWRNVDFVDNYTCLELISGRPTGVMHLIDEESSFPGATETSLLDKINKTHSSHSNYVPSLLDPSFEIKHYAGAVQYSIKGFLDKNRDLMRPDILSVLKSSNLRFIRELLGADPMAIYRWSVVRSFFKAVHAFKLSGRLYRMSGKASEKTAVRRGKRNSKTLRMSSILNPNDESNMSYPETASLIRKASRVIRRMHSNKTSQAQSKFRHGLETKRDMSMRTYDYLYKAANQRGKAAPKNPPTVSAQFQSSLNRLMEILGAAQPFFVRCIRSNADKAPLKFDCDVVQRQLRYTGMLETVRIRRLGYQWRFHLEEFVKRYSLLFQGIITDPHKEIPRVLKTLNLDANEYQIGKTKIFLRESQHRILQDHLHTKLLEKVRLIQTWTRGVLQRRQYLRQRRAAITIQAAFRGFLARMDLDQQHCAAVRIQAAWRGYYAFVNYHRLLDNIVLLQAVVRGFLERQRFLKLLDERRLEEEDRLRRASILAEVSMRPKLVDVDSRRLVRSLSDPTEYEKLKNRLYQIDEKPEVQTPEVKLSRSDSETPQKSPGVREMSKMFEREISLLKPADHIRTRAATDSYKNRIHKTGRPTPLMVNTHRAEQQRGLDLDVIKLTPMRSPKEVLQIQENKIASADNPPSTFSRRVSTSIRRRLSTKSKNKQQRSSTSDIPDVVPTAPPEDEDVLEEPRLGSTTAIYEIGKLSASSENIRKTKRSIFRRRNRHSMRRKSEPGLAKNSTKRSAIKPSRSEEELLNEIKSTKIISTVSKAAIIPGNQQLKPTNKKFAKGAADFAALESFLMNKISDMNHEGRKRDTIVDGVFKKSLQEFHAFLISEYSWVMNHDKSVSLKYEDMCSSFEEILKKTIKKERISASFPAIMGTNAFAGVLDEFFLIRSSQDIPAKVPKVHKRRHKKGKNEVVHNHHKFSVTQFSIPTFCEHCNSLIWVLEKGMVCQDCRFTCHKKCHTKSTLLCSKNTFKTTTKRSSVFGGDLGEDTSIEQPVPEIVERLIQDIEIRGLYAEGIYRKSPSAVAVRALKNAIVSSGISDLDLSSHVVHVVAAVLKLFFRQLSSPVFTDDVYNEVIRTADLSDEREQLETLYALVQKLPPANRATFERLVFHLARVAEHESSNLMNSNALSIIWAPCIMRPPANVSPIESLQHVAKQTQCLEVLIKGQVTKIRATLNDIRVLDKAADTANKRLSMLNLHKEEDEGQVEHGLSGEDGVKTLLTQQLEALQEQRTFLTAKLTTLEPRPRAKGGESGDDVVSDENVTDDELENAINEEYAVTFELPAVTTDLRHLTKHRARKQTKKRPPSRSRLRVQRKHVV
ncbi:unconventional myosin-IXAa [Nematostella vectensis]|uniref:unconventional myosin-IXAa n=1 Tax=Nematostella vectensis TaxID=45351 RepID=UPI0020777593|nr:unconventional myosin-IXAa [Nematostella vectensis]